MTGSVFIKRDGDKEWEYLSREMVEVPSKPGMFVLNVKPATRKILFLRGVTNDIIGPIDEPILQTTTQFTFGRDQELDSYWANLEEKERLRDIEESKPKIKICDCCCHTNPGFLHFRACCVVCRRCGISYSQGIEEHENQCKGSTPQ